MLPSATGSSEKNASRFSHLFPAKYRVPDELTPTMLREIKNVKELRMTPQIVDFLEYARDTDRIFVIVVRQGTQVADIVHDLENTGEIVIRRFL